MLQLFPEQYAAYKARTGMPRPCHSAALKRSSALRPTSPIHSSSKRTARTTPWGRRSLRPKLSGSRRRIDALGAREGLRLARYAGTDDSVFGVVERQSVRSVGEFFGVRVARGRQL